MSMSAIDAYKPLAAAPLNYRSVCFSSL